MSKGIEGEEQVQSVSFAVKYKIEILLFIIVLFAGGYFFSTGAWNQIARYDPVYSFVETGYEQYSFKIDRFIVSPVYNTVDWSRYEGHYYSNKAPGSHLLGIPVYFVFYHLSNILGIPYNHPYMEIFSAYVINFFVSVLMTALSAVFFYRFCLLRGRTEQSSAVFTIIYIFATAILPFSTALWGHCTAAAFVVFCIYNLQKGGKLNLLWAGFWIGFAVLTDYLSAILVCCIGVYILIKVPKKIIWYCLGGVVPMLIFMYYHYVCFGGPFTLPTAYMNPVFLEKDRALGVFGHFDFIVLFKLLFSTHRGLFFSMPVLLLAPLGLFYLIKKNRKDFLAYLAGISLISILLANSSFNGWHGGDSVIARYQIIALPFWALLLAGISWNKWTKYAVAVTSLISFVNMFIIMSVSTNYLSSHTNPIWGHLFKELSAGRVSIYAYGVKLSKLHPDFDKFKDLNAFNYGKIIGLEGLLSLVPFILVMSLGIFFLWKALKDRSDSQRKIAEEAEAENA